MSLRVISLIASATETVCALGFEQALVGRSHECDWPDSVTRLPVCTAPKFDVSDTSQEIDRRVKSILQEGLAVYRVDTHKLRELQPDLIVTQSQCDVCAVSLKDVEQALCHFLEGRPRLVSLAPNSLADVWSDMRRVAEACGVPERGAGLVDRLQLRMTGLSRRCCRALADRPTLACIEWIDPLMACGNWMPELVQLAGGRNLFGKAGAHSPWMSWDELRDADPDVILVTPCGFDIGRTRAEMPVMESRPGWSELAAVRNSRVVLADGSQYFNRPGPRLAESLEILAEALHPQELHFGHEGTGWERH